MNYFIIIICMNFNFEYISKHYNLKINRKIINDEMMRNKFNIMFKFLKYVL